MKCSKLHHRLFENMKQENSHENDFSMLIKFYISSSLSAMNAKEEKIIKLEFLPARCKVIEHDFRCDHDKHAARSDSSARVISNRFIISKASSLINE